jgi:hypothetical protein
MIVFIQCNTNTPEIVLHVSSYNFVKLKTNLPVHCRDYLQLKRLELSARSTTYVKLLSIDIQSRSKDSLSSKESKISNRSRRSRPASHGCAWASLWKVRDPRRSSKSLPQSVHRTTRQMICDEVPCRAVKPLESVRQWPPRST